MADVLVVLLALCFVVAIYVFVCLPFYFIGQRSDVSRPWIAFIPILGVWIVLFETFRRSGWFSLLVLVPYLGFFVLAIWAAIEVPRRHERSVGWAFVLWIPLVNIVAYWIYAVTLERDSTPTLLGSAA